MTVLLLLVAGALWLTAHLKSRPELVRIAAGVQLAGAAATMVLRGDLLPAGWATVFVLAAALPAIAIAARPNAKWALSLLPAQGVLTLLAAVWSAAAPGNGVPQWTGWAIPHITLSVAGISAAVVAGMFALSRLQGATIGLLSAALLITAAPLNSDKAGAVVLYSGGEVAQGTVELATPVGGVGAVITRNATADLPGERPLRWAGVIALLIALSVAVVRWANDAPPGDPGIGLLAAAALAVHLVWVASAMLPRDLGVDRADVEERLRANVLRSATTSESAGAVTLPEGPLTGGPGAPAAPLGLALVALTLTVLAFRPEADDAANPGWEPRAVALAVVLLAGAAATGMVWSNYSWGGPTIPDPKLYAMLGAMTLYGAYFAARGANAGARTTSWLALLAVTLLVLSMIGADLGWTAPSLHDFGA